MRGMLLAVLVLGLAACEAGVARGAGNLLLNGNLDAHHSVEYDPANYPGLLNEYPDHWQMVSDFNIPTPFVDGFSSEEWAGGTASPDTNPGDRGVFFKSFFGGAPWIQGANPTITTHLYQDVPGTAGLQYVLTGWAAAESNYSGLAAPGGQTYLALDFLNGVGATIVSEVLDLEAHGLAVNPRDAAIEGPWNWTLYTVTKAAPAGTATVRARVSMFNGFYNVDPGQALIVDDFTLTSVPEPASVALIGWALASLAGMRWRRI
jgi:hypothetical protein